MNWNQFYQKYSGVTHSIAAIITSLIVAYNAVPQFHDLVMSVYNTLSQPDKTMITTGIALYIWYRNGQKAVPIPAWKKRQKAQQAYQKKIGLP